MRQSFAKISAARAADDDAAVKCDCQAFDKLSALHLAIDTELHGNSWPSPKKEEGGSRFARTAPFIPLPTLRSGVFEADQGLTHPDIE